MLTILLASLLLSANADTVRVDPDHTYLVSADGIVSVSRDSVRARLPWSASPGISPAASCEGPDLGLIVLDASKGGRILHLDPTLRVVSSHPLPEGIHASELSSAKATWDRARGLSIAVARPPSRWFLGFLAGPPVELTLTDSVENR